MRPPRVIIAVTFFTATVLLTFLCLRSSRSPRTIATSSPEPPRTGILAFFSFGTPFTLFPPNAIITLTHENTTAFLARPAGFGPSLPAEGLQGQVWLGSGFGDVAAGGELGCSDVPGWEDGSVNSAAIPGGKLLDGKSAPASAKTNPQRKAEKDEDGPFDDQSEYADSAAETRPGPPADDGTDDYLHHPLPDSTVTKPTKNQSVKPPGSHADIQSIQEGAEITGKVVLLSRGGCGFLEKVKWSQRRGAIALIVGDDTKGGALIQMYARGDTSNITIPSIFTSYTTAHLLASLVGPGSFIEDVVGENGKPLLKAQQTNLRKKKHGSNPTFAATTGPKMATEALNPPSKVTHKKTSSKTEAKAPTMTTKRPGWFRSLFLGGGSNSESESSRPPTSGQLDWVLVDEWKDDDEFKPKYIPTKPNRKIERPKKIEPITNASVKPKPASDDDFVIGVQDWRDPDLVVPASSKEEDDKQHAYKEKPGLQKDIAKGDTTTKNLTPQPTKLPGKEHLGGVLQEIPPYHPPLRGGSITPSSGEYPKDSVGGKTGVVEESTQDVDAHGKSKGLLTTIFGDDEENFEFLELQKIGEDNNNNKEEGDDDDEYEGLWVTLTPTTGASPFLDTLLVLVVSPLVTLTVVYALLLIRSRIRRRRWRAPKSVVERLPVRTYMTRVSPGNQSPRSPSPSVTTPLLQNTTLVRPRPRSRTTTGIPEPGDFLWVNSNPLQVPINSPRPPEAEKNASESSEWKKHMGKQVECVICLEDDVEGVSRVMSLPCGHEFHADCITPWLTTRRRTCPICKGDVVRSLARGVPSSPRYEPYHDDSDDDIQYQAAETINDSSSAALPIPGTLNVEDDLEQGVSPPPPQSYGTNPTGSWRGLLSSGFGVLSRSPRLPQEDRNR